MAVRTDPHRPGAIIPAHYEYVFSYNGATSQDGWPIPSYRINCELDRRVLDADGKIVKNGEHDPDGLCCIVGMRRSGKPFVSTGSTGACSVCSTPFVYGDIWRYTLTGEYLFVGHICAEKYTLLADRSEWELHHKRAKEAAAVALIKAQKAKARRAFFDANPGLEDALTLDHAILRDLNEKLGKWGLSEKQVALALKIADEVRNPRPADVMVPAPTGKGLTVRGTVVTVKEYESSFGGSRYSGPSVFFKMAVKVTTPGGNWIAWGTVPRALGPVNELRGKTVEFVANLERGRDAHFALFSRPRLAEIVDLNETTRSTTSSLV